MSVDSESIESQFNISSSNLNAESIYEFGNFRLDASRLMLYKDEEEVDLAPKVVETLLALIERSGKIVSKEQLFERLWRGAFVDESNLTQNIYLLRKTLGNTPDGRPLIETFRRRGYRFNGEVRTKPDEAEDRVTDRKSVLEIAASPHQKTHKNFLLIGAMAVAAITLLGASAVWYVFLRRTQAETPAALPPQNISFRRLTPHLYIFSPVLSPDGKYLAYCLVEKAGPSLWIKELTSGKTTQLLPAVNKAYRHLRFSPDSTQLYFATQNNTLARISISGEAPEELVSGVINPFTLSPDGSQAAFVRGRHLVVADINSGAEKNLSERDGSSKWFSALTAQPSWSPDGKKIIISGGYIELGQKSAELIEVAVDSGAERRIPTPRWDAINSVAWSPDGSGLFVTARERITASAQIWLLSYPGGAASRITNDLQSYDWLSVSADSRMLMAEKVVGACNLWIGSLDDPGNIKQVTFDDSEVTGRSGLSLAADGMVIFTAEYSGNLDLWQIDADGEGLKQLTANTSDWSGRQQISKDGKYIVFVSRRAGTKRSIWRIDADGANPFQLTPGGQDYPSISPDGKWVYYTELSGESPSVWKVAIEGGESRLISGDYPASLPSVSPDGTRLAYIHGGSEPMADAGKIAILDLDGNSPPKLFEALAFRGVMHWTADGKSILYIQKGSPNLWQQPVDGSPPKQLTNFDLETTWNFAVSPDSTKVVFARGDATSEAVLITNFRALP